MSLLIMQDSIRKFLSYAKPYTRLFILATICGVLKYNIPVLFPWILKDIIDLLLQTPPPAPQSIHFKIGLLLILYLFWMVVTYYRSYFADTAGQRMMFDLRHDLYVHLQKMSLGFYERQQIGAITSRLIGDIATAQNFVGGVFTNTIMDLTSLLFITVMLFRMNALLAVVSLSILPFYVILNKTFKKRIRKASHLAQRKLEEMTGEVNEKLKGISLIQAYTYEKVEERRFFKKQRDYLKYRIDGIKNSAAAVSVIGFLTSIAPVLVVWVGSLLVLRNRLTVGELTAFYAYLAMFYQPLNRLTELNLLLANSQSAIERIFEIFKTHPDIQDSPSARQIRSVRGEIVFDHVFFGYEPGRLVLHDISITIEPGTTTALVGPSGSGKSTFIKLIPRFYDVTRGTIYLDGIDIREIELKTLRRQIALVSQDPILFSGNIYENILMGDPDATEEEVIRSAMLANAHEFIMALPEGYQTEIGEGGVKLSGGQRQRIALARSFLKNAPILILDEATSSLDSESESAIQDALEKLMQGRTTIIIAHRLSTIQHADRIVVFHQGRIVEIGTHEMLLSKRGGLYRKLYEAKGPVFLENVGISCGGS